MTGRLSAHGLSVALVPGWDVQILRRDESALLLASPDGDVPVGGYALPMIHAATITMPPLRGLAPRVSWAVPTQAVAASERAASARRA